MARHIFQNLTKLSSPNFYPKPTKFIPISISSQFITNKFFSSKAQLFEIDLDSSSSSSDIEVMGLKRLEDAIHSIIVRRLAPDWLPFRPGSSYWVPPKRSSGDILEVVGKLTNPLSEEESLSISSAGGWPSSSFFLDGIVFEHPIPVELDVQVDVQNAPEKTTNDEEK